MNKKIIVSAFVAAFLATSASAFAQDHRHQDEHSYHQHDAGRGNDHRHVNYRGAGPRHDLRQGVRLPSEYRNSRYVVNDWRGHRLSAPPRGYHWVQTGNDYVLATVATGLIAQVFLN